MNIVQISVGVRFSAPQKSDTVHLPSEKYHSLKCGKQDLLIEFKHQEITEIWQHRGVCFDGRAQVFQYTADLTWSKSVKQDGSAFSHQQ